MDALSRQTQQQQQQQQAASSERVGPSVRHVMSAASGRLVAADFMRTL